MNIKDDGIPVTLEDDPSLDGKSRESKKEKEKKREKEKPTGHDLVYQ